MDLRGKRATCSSKMLTTIMTSWRNCFPDQGRVKLDDVIKWKHFPRYWSFVRGIHRSLVNSPHKGQWHGALMFSLIYAWIKGWVNNRTAGDLRYHRTHYDVIVMNTMTCHSLLHVYSVCITQTNNNMGAKVLVNVMFWGPKLYEEIYGKEWSDKWKQELNIQ